MKRIYKGILILSLAGMLVLGALLGLIVYTGGIDQADLEAPYVVVLGARLYADKPSPALIERLSTALNYLEHHPHTKVIVSGAMAGGETITEAEAMKSWLIARGLDPERILMDERSSNTFENLKYSREIISNQKGENRIAISTSAYHQFRAGFLAKRLGLEFIRLPAVNPPSERIKAHVREVLAVVKSFLFDHE